MHFHKFYKLARYEREYAHKRLKENGLSDTEYLICMYLHAHGNMSQESISRGLCTNKTTVAKAVRSLENKSIVSSTQNPDNRRENIVELSAHGREIVDAVRDLYNEWMEKVTRCLSDEEKQTFESCLVKMLESATAIDMPSAT